jgi:hypothetical protein
MTEQNLTSKEKSDLLNEMWNKNTANCVSLCAICNVCGGSSISTCACARKKFFENTSLDKIIEYKNKTYGNKQNTPVSAFSGLNSGGMTGSSGFGVGSNLNGFSSFGGESNLNESSGFGFGRGSNLNGSSGFGGGSNGFGGGSNLSGSNGFGGGFNSNEFLNAGSKKKQLHDLEKERLILISKLDMINHEIRNLLLEN